MRRLTSNAPLTESEAMNLSVTDLYDRLKAYEDTGLEPEEVLNALEMADLFAELRKLDKVKEAEAEGRLLILPCAVRGRIYAVEFGNIREVIVNQFFYDGSSIIVNYYYNHFGHVEGIGIYGKTVFLTSEEAAEACNGRVNDG